MRDTISGEQLVRHRAGFDRPGWSGPTRHRQVPPAAAEFLTRQPMLVAGAADPADGRVWTGLLTGRPGFLRVEPGRADTVTVATRPGAGDPLAGLLDRPAHLGSIALEPAKRRRMRMNGLSSPAGPGLRLELAEVFANCPKYIQAREFELLPTPPAPGPILTGRQLSSAQAEFILAADTFFISTTDARGHLDTSHRGGRPGFVEALGPARLRWPDYSGNAMFATLGNLAENPAAGLLFVDWRTGSALHLTGTARTDWDSHRAAEVPGAQRLVDFEVTGVLERPGALPLRWGAPDYSPFNPPAPVRRS